MLFQQTSAPTGWTKQSTHNNKSLRVVSGTAGSGGATAFTSIFGSSVSTNAHTLTTAEMPVHSHTATVTDPGHATKDTEVFFLVERHKVQVVYLEVNHSIQ